MHFFRKHRKNGIEGISRSVWTLRNEDCYEVSLITIIGNILLSLIKLLAGIIAHSNAMISDAIHSASDVFSTFIVIIGIKLASRKPDKEHPYGHERLECVAAIVLAIVLFVTGLGIGSSAFKNIVSGNYKELGIAGARLGLPIMDSIASLVIFLFIIKAAYDIFKDAIDKMVDRSCDDTTEKQIYDCVMQNDNVLGVDLLHTRIFGNKIYVDVEIRVDASYTLKYAHEIAEAVHNNIEKTFPKVKHIMIHVNPAM